jgi:hypothetical protein
MAKKSAEKLTDIDYEQLPQLDKRGRCWVFTLNGLGVPFSQYTLENVYSKIQSLSELAHVRYICGGVESGKKTNRLHFQGYVEFTKSMRYTTVGNLLDNNFTKLKYKPKKQRNKLSRGYTYSKKNEPHNLTWIQRKKGTREQAKNYAMKIEQYLDEADTQILQPIQYGKWVENGQRLDLEDLANDIVEGKTDYQIFERDSVAFMRHIKMIKETRSMLLETKFNTIYRHVEVCYIYGTTRSGKTTLITNHFGYENVYRITDSKNPWDGYTNQDVIIFEEFRETFPLENMLSWLEGHPVQLPARYFNRPAAYTKVFIISNWPWSRQYEIARESIPDDYAALLARLNHVIEIRRINDVTTISKHTNSPLNIIFNHNDNYPSILIQNHLIDGNGVD